MIKMFTARTSEVDDINAAVNEIQSRLDLSALKKHSGGIIFCHLDYMDSGVAAAICEALPFEIIGMTTMASADDSGYGLFDLTLAVLTSDEVTFPAGITGDINADNFCTEVEQLYKNILSKTKEEPSLLITFMPYLSTVSGDQMLEAMNTICNGVPMWGSISNNTDFSYCNVRTLYNSEIRPAGVAMMALSGKIDPKFIISSIPQSGIGDRRAVITKSDGAVLYEVNDVPILQYLEKMGLIITEESLSTTPLMVYYENASEPVSLGFYTLFDDGSVLLGGKVPEGTSFAVGSIDPQILLKSADYGLEQILKHSDRGATLILPCVTRYIMLSPNQQDELRMIGEKLNESGLPYIMGYSGGEISPITGKDGKLHNRFHNYTFCAVVL